MLIFCDFIQVYAFTTNYHLKCKYTYSFYNFRHMNEFREMGCCAVCGLVVSVLQKRRGKSG